MYKYLCNFCKAFADLMLWDYRKKAEAKRHVSTINSLRDQITNCGVTQTIGINERYKLKLVLEFVKNCPENSMTPNNAYKCLADKKNPLIEFYLNNIRNIEQEGFSVEEAYNNFSKTSLVDNLFNVTDRSSTYNSLVLRRVITGIFKEKEIGDCESGPAILIAAFLGQNQLKCILGVKKNIFDEEIGFISRVENNSSLETSVN